MDPIFVFLISGAFSMSAAIAASKLLKLADDEKPQWLRSGSGNTRVLLMGNVFAVILVAAVVFGVYHMAWWIPVACLFVTFPVIHVVIIEKLLSAEKGFFVSGALALATAPLLWFFW